MVEHLAGLDEALMLGLYHVFPCGKVLGKDLTVVLCLFTLLRDVRILYPNHLRLFRIIYTIELYLLKHDFCLIVVSLETRHKAKLIRFCDGDNHDVNKRYEDDCNSGEQFIIGVLGNDDDGGNEYDEEHD